MKTFASIYLDNTYVPNDSLIYNALSEVGYEGFIPKNFIADLLIISKLRLIRKEIPKEISEYISSIYNIVYTSNITLWIRDTIYLLKKIGDKYDLRVIEAYANSGINFKLEDIKFSYNYLFDIKNINTYTRQLLNITEDQLNQVEKLPEDVIKVLTIASGLGSFLKTSKQIISSYKQMVSYGDIAKVHKHVFADPLFKYKFSIKAYDLDRDEVITHKSNKIVVGYFFGNYERQGVINVLLKLLGSILLNNYTENVKIIMYSFYMDTYSKKELSSVQEIIQYFSSPKQLKVFLINNSKSLEHMITENIGDDIIFIPNILGGCFIKNKLSGENRVNIISVDESRYNIQYSNICKKTGGTFLTI